MRERLLYLLPVPVLTWTDIYKSYIYIYIYIYIYTFGPDCYGALQEWGLRTHAGQ